jgi:hypothetical protein
MASSPNLSGESPEDPGAESHDDDIVTRFDPIASIHSAYQRWSEAAESRQAAVEARMDPRLDQAARSGGLRYRLGAILLLPATAAAGFSFGTFMGPLLDWEPSFAAVSVLSLPYVLVLTTWAIPLTLRWWHLANSLAQPSAQSVLTDADDIVWYIRRFDFDPRTGEGDEFDENGFAKVFAAVGEPVALGRPNERFPPVGFRRAYLQHDNWQEVVEDYLAKSRLVVLLAAGESTAIAWEVDRCTEGRNINKLLILVHRSDKYEEFRRAYGARFPGGLPTLPRSVTDSRTPIAAIWFPSGTTSEVRVLRTYIDLWDILHDMRLVPKAPPFHWNWIQEVLSASAEERRARRVPS